MVKDPVCGMEVDEKTAIKTEYDGKKYYFCDESCKTEFEKNPSKYLKEVKHAHHGC
ncbi:MAG: YHS domain-containing protein [Thermoplasmata archaeon]